MAEVDDDTRQQLREVATQFQVRRYVREAPLLAPFTDNELDFARRDVGPLIDALLPVVAAYGDRRAQQARNEAERPHCSTCSCGCTCGYGGLHEPDNQRCELVRGGSEVGQ